MRTLLTIDWDFFVREKMSWDLGHNESPMFLNFIWATRGHLVKEMQPRGHKTFWRRLKKQLNISKAPLFVSDSHLYAHELCSANSWAIDHVINIDAHHDCWAPNRPGIVDCSNWLYTWLVHSIFGERIAHWVRPHWPDHCVASLDMVLGEAELSEVNFDDLPEANVVCIHICRSGCWTPPWADQAFIDFVDALKKTPHIMQNGDWNPMRKRWTNENMHEALKNAEKTCRAMMELAHNVDRRVR